nr:MAG TPA: hypothetical protein [Caudoviricetes sp.]
MLLSEGLIAPSTSLWRRILVLSKPLSNFLL